MLDGLKLKLQNYMIRRAVRRDAGFAPMMLAMLNTTHYMQGYEAGNADGYNAGRIQTPAHISEYAIDLNVCPGCGVKVQSGLLIRGTGRYTGRRVCWTCEVQELMTTMDVSPLLRKLLGVVGRYADDSTESGHSRQDVDK